MNALCTWKGLAAIAIASAPAVTASGQATLSISPTACSWGAPYLYVRASASYGALNQHLMTPAIPMQTSDAVQDYDSQHSPGSSATSNATYSLTDSALVFSYSLSHLGLATSAATTAIEGSVFFTVNSATTCLASSELTATGTSGANTESAGYSLDECNGSSLSGLVNYNGSGLNGDGSQSHTSCGIVLLPGRIYRFTYSAAAGSVYTLPPYTPSSGNAMGTIRLMLVGNTPPVADLSGPVCSSNSASLIVSNLPPNPTAYQWQWRPSGTLTWADVAEGANTNPFSGDPFTATGTQLQGLTLKGSSSQYALYRCIVTGACGSQTTNETGFSLSSNTEPSITQQPESTKSCPTDASSFTVTAFGALTYQWQIQTSSPPNETWQTLTSDPSPISCPSGGTGTAVATPVNSPTVSIGVRGCLGSGGATNHWPVRCVVSNACGSVVSNPAILTICAADFNCDGFLDFTDFDGFVNAFEAGDTSGDFNNDGFIDFTDFDAFVSEFEAGC